MISLYVHVPFCAARCPYCDFATAPATSRLRSRYQGALAAEIRREGAALDRPRVRTLYIGGGTPSLLEPDEIAQLAAALRESFDLEAIEPVEATVEANPATLDRARLDAWRALGRTHQPEDTAAAVVAARSVGLDVSLDLIFGWAGQTLDLWRADLAAAAALRPDHISCYPLELVLEPEEAVANWPGTGWEAVRRWREANAAVVPQDDQVARMYRIAERSLRTAGFEHYEIANWAQPGKRCEHNLTYWRNGEWLGVGTGAHSHLAGARSRRPGSVARYIEQIEQGAPRIADAHADEASDTAMLALRLGDGLSLHGYRARFGDEPAARVRAALDDAAGLGLVRWSEDIARLTPRGRLLASEVFVRLLADDDATTSARTVLSLATMR